MREIMEERIAAWKEAEALVRPIVDEHSLESYRGAAVAFNTGQTFTKVDQHIDHVMHIANWLMGED